MLLKESGIVFVIGLVNFLGSALGQTCTFTDQCQTWLRINYRCGFGFCVQYMQINYNCDRTESCTNSFGAWSTCLASCAPGGTREREVTCTSDTSARTCMSTETVACNTQPCPVNGEWSSWGTWANVGSCSASCAPGGLQNQERTRVCDNPPPSNGGATCPGSDTDTQQLTCNTQACPVDGSWSLWTNWAESGSCSVTCCGGTVPQTRTRQCDDPPASGGGMTCPGDSIEDRTRSCGSDRRDQCPVVCQAGDTTFPDTCRRCVRRHYTCVGGVAEETSCPSGQVYSVFLTGCTTPQDCEDNDP